MIQIDMEMPKNCLDCNLRYQSFCSVDGHHEPHLEKERCPLKVTPQEPIKKLEEQIKQLQNRCHALTHGQICVFCPYECEHRVEVEPQESEDT